MKLLQHRLPLFLLLMVIGSSCMKEAIPEPCCTCEQQALTEAKKWLIATTWQIEEVVDPIAGVRYKRGVVNDSKNFASARYQYHDDNTLTGTDWFGQPLESNCYTLLDKDQKIRLVTPSCSSVETIINLSATQFVYKAADGSVITLQPIHSTGNPSREL